MSSDLARRASPLDGFFDEFAADRADGSAVVITERPGLGYLNIRCGPGDAGLAGAALPFPLPTEPNATAEASGTAALWLGPDEWLVVTAPDAQLELAASLGRALSGAHSAVTDVSGGLTTIAVSGPASREVLARGCTLDLHPASFGAGDCAQTLIAKAGAVVRPVGDPAAYDLIVRSSFAEYLARWLLDAAAGCGGGAVRQPE